MDAPVIQTERLILRPHRADDFEAYARMWSDADVIRHIGGKPFTPEQTWSRLLRGRGMWATIGFGMWALEDKTTGQLAGEAGFLELRRDVEPTLEGTLEAGWVLAPAFHGRGYATEAVAAAMNWAEANHPGAGITCMIDPGNLGSQRVAAKFGFRAFAETTYQGNPVILFRRRVAGDR